MYWLSLKKILAQEEPPGCRVAPPREAIAPLFIFRRILADDTAPKRRWHTAHRIWKRLGNA